ncbi:radical SAM protein [Candidatus Atribacteria bacterium HGW-Atribacteria-1]|nr:MAG: radical SAM protein [Candidatus Atribacteria bacterium HGW-Atribacteria-1]
MNDFDKLITKSREISWRRFGKKITFFHPGMFKYNGKWGNYSAISITGKHCELQCDHCNSKILESMIFATTPEELIEKCIRLEELGNTGCLISGGSQKDGTIPWYNFISAIKTVKETTNLFISIHSGIIDYQMAKKMKDAGVDQALIDVIGDEETFKKIYHVNFGITKIEESLDALRNTGLSIIPHIVVGLDYGKIKGEYHAIDLIKRYSPEVLVIVSLMPLSGTPMRDILPPNPEEVAKIIATARIEMTDVPISLGCARERANSLIDVLAVECGVNRIAIPSEEAIKKAQEYGLDIIWKKTCCSVPINLKEV